MNTLFDLVIKLKDDLIRVQVDVLLVETYIGNKDIHKIRRGIKKIGDDFSNVESLSFLNYCFDFRAIKNHFYSLEYFSNFDDPMNEISV
ncbi:MAG TPA: hypothetical protein VK068_03630, partial [Jeotgalicoccus sp.]|nr:hypothetical protein [Jeotgalicoccus sp.]